MNILSGIGFAAAGIGAIRKAFGAPPEKEKIPKGFTADEWADFVEERRAKEAAEIYQRDVIAAQKAGTALPPPPLPVSQTVQAELSTGRFRDLPRDAGDIAKEDKKVRKAVRKKEAEARQRQKAIAEQNRRAWPGFRYTRGYLRFEQEPLLVTITSESELADFYLQYGYPFEKGDVIPPHQLPREVVERTAIERAKKDWAARKIGTVPVESAATPEHGPVVVWDSMSRIPTRGRVSMEEIRKVHFVDEDGQHIFKKLGDFTKAERRLMKLTKERSLLAKSLARETESYRMATGQKYSNVEVVSCKPTLAPLCASIAHLMKELDDKDETIHELEKEIAATANAAATARLIKSATDAAEQFKRRGVAARDAIVIAAPGIVRIRGGASRTGAMNAEELEAYLDRVNRNQFYGYQEAVLEPMIEASEEALREFNRLYGQARQREYKTRNQGTRGKIRPGAKFREYIPGQDEDLDGMDAAAGITAPNVALVDGLGMSGQAATLGIGSIVLIGAGAYLAYRVFRSSADKATA